MRSERSHQRVCSLATPTCLALVVAFDCSVDRSGLGGGAGTTTMMAGAGGSLSGTGGIAGSVPDGEAGSGGAAGGDTGAGGTAASGGATGSGSGGTLGLGGGFAGGGGTLGLGGGFAGGGDNGGDPSGADDGGNRSDAPLPAAGCADGTREAFTDEARFPSIAGCAGAWSVPGLLTEGSMAPGCARAAGNDGSNVMGRDCSVEDLCADGWHVCRGASELTLLGVTCQDAGIRPANLRGEATFFATRQRGTPPTGCSPNATTGSNNLHGCGNFGRAEDPGCAPPLDRQIENTVCAANPPWSCNDPTSIMTEAMVATKPGAAGGGVLCCR